MTTVQLRKMTKKRLDLLPPGKFKVAAEFIEYLTASGGFEATSELLQIQGFEKDLAEAEREVSAGRVTPAEELRRKWRRHA